MEFIIDHDDKQRRNYYPINSSTAKEAANMEPACDFVTKRQSEWPFLKSSILAPKLNLQCFLTHLARLKYYQRITLFVLENQRYYAKSGDMILKDGICMGWKKLEGVGIEM